MQEDTKPPGFGQYVLGVTLGLLAIAAGGISLSMNYAFGLQAGLITAAIFVVSDLTKIILPMTTAALGGWNIHRKAVYLIAVVISIMAACSYLLESQAERLLASQADQRIVSGARADSDRIRNELAQIGERGEVATLTSLHAEAQAKADREAGRGGCGSRCEAAKDDAARLLSRLSQAKRRVELERQLTEAKQTVSAIKVEANGASDTLAILTGGDKDQIATHEAIVKSVFMLIVLELIAALSGAAGNMIVTTWKARQAAKPTRKQAKSEKTAAKASEISPKKPAASYWLARLSKERPDLAGKVMAGQISTYRACIQAGIRKAPKSKWTKPEAYVKSVAVTQ